MVRRISTSQLRSQLQRFQQQQRQAVNKYYESVRKLKREVDKYNQAARAHNSRVRANKQRLQSELRRLASRPATTTTRHVFRTSVQTVYRAYTRLERDVEVRGLGPQFGQVLDLSEREAANSVGVMNSLLGTEPEADDAYGLQDSAVQNELRGISPELDDRWRGAIFSLNPSNPDAARHFCTSVREVFTQVLAIKAPHKDVLDALPNCETHDGRPTRRARIQYCLHRKSMSLDSLEEFVEQDLDNIVQLFDELSAGTHGPAGHFSMRQLSAIKKRVEDGLLFLTSVLNE